MAKKVNEENMAEETVEEVVENTEEETAEETAEAEEKQPLTREEELEAEVAAIKDKLARKIAEFDNYKKRTAKEKEELYAMGVCGAVEKILAVKDNLERALTTVDTGQDEAIAEGVKMIDKQFDDVLNEIGVEAILAIGEEFDPEKHNAVMHDENEKFGENTVSEEFMKGYMYKDKVIRHSMVKVSN